MYLYFHLIDGETGSKKINFKLAGTNLAFLRETGQVMGKEYFGFEERFEKIRWKDAEQHLQRESEMKSLLPLPWFLYGEGEHTG